MRKLDERLERYDKLLLRENEILRLLPSPKSLHRQYFNWIYNEKPLVKAEYSFIYHQDDFISLGLTEDGWLGPFIKDVGRMMPEWLLRVRYSFVLIQERVVILTVDGVHADCVAS
jgi:hypothetical protein